MNNQNENKTNFFTCSSHASWLLTCPCSDGNFRPHLLAASEEEIEEVISSLPEEGNKTKIKVLEKELKKRRKEKGKNENV